MTSSGDTAVSVVAVPSIAEAVVCLGRVDTVSDICCGILDEHRGESTGTNVRSMHQWGIK
jgi:hypothetical protein